MLLLKNKSLINTKIAQFYKVETITTENCDNLLIYFNDNGTFNAKKIVQHLWPLRNIEEIFKDVENYRYEDYLLCFNKLLPIFQYSDIVLKRLRETSSHGLQLQWMGNNVEVYLDMCSSYCNNNKTEIFEHILVLTSIFANALTNVYLSQTQSKHAPHLLKDIINSKEIMDIFGLEMVVILKILMGSPNSINLRNIVWHGFPKPEEIPNYYVNVLLLTIHSLGCIIQTKQLKIQERSQITTFNDHIKLILQNYKVEPVDLLQIQEKILNLNNEYKYYWLQLLFYYKSKKYKEFIILALTQIELLLRLHYGQVNNFDITAKLDEYYITMDTIFENEVPNTEICNKLLDFDNSAFEKCFHLLYDLFLSPNGCRLRDKVSHGEVYLKALNNSELCAVVLNILIFLLFPAEYNLFINYESIWHLNSKTKALLIKSNDRLLKFIEKQFAYKEDFCLSGLKNQQRVFIFKRPKKEAEFMLLIYKISENLYKCVENYEESIALRSSLLAQRELHSKRRKTLEKLQNTLPDVFKTLSGIWMAISKLFNLLQHHFEKILDEEYVCQKTLRFLKHSLSISENFIKYSHYESNEWIKSLELCRKYEECNEKWFLF